MRWDSRGIFWQDLPVSRKRGQVIRMMPPIPETGWRPPTYFPRIREADILSVDVETYDPEIDKHGPGWARHVGNIAGISIGTGDGYRWYYPIRHTVHPELNLNPEHVLAWLKDEFEQYHGPLVGANLIYDLGWLREHGIFIDCELHDVQYAESLLEEYARVGLETLSQKYLGVGKAGAEIYQWCSDYYGGAPTHDVQAKNIYRAPPELAGPYGEGDADRPIRILPFVLERLQQEGLYELYRMECDIIPLLIEMRFAGVSVDTRKAEELTDVLDHKVRTYQAELDKTLGFPVRVGSSNELAHAFDSLGLKYPRTKPSKKAPEGKPSFKKDFLKTVDHPVAQLIREIKRIEKLNGTFVKGYILNGNINGKVYGSFNPLRKDDGGAKSGRFSSDHPNLQNLPIRDKELGKLIRSIFIPDPGHPFWRKFDYSQIEYRMLVHYAVGPGSEEARQRYRDRPDTDYHKWVQELVEGIFKRQVDRRPIKNLNFGLTFGMGKKKLIRSMELKTEREADEFLEAYHKGVPFAKPTMDWAMTTAKNLGVITTLLGRKARFDLWEPARMREGQEYPALPYQVAIRLYGNVRRAYLHKALNRLLQGSAADLIKAAMVKCWKDGVFKATGVPRLQVHDELDFSDPKTKESEEGFKEVGRIMENVVPISIPIVADEEEDLANWGAAA